MPEDRTTTRRQFLSLHGAAAIAGCAGVNLSVCNDAMATSSAHWNRMPHPPVHASGPNGAVISGFCAPAFRSVFDAFVANFNHRGELGASIGVTFKGVPVLEAWGGWADTFAPTHTVPWNRDTVCLAFSCTKGATALAAHTLIAGGLLDLDKPVAFYWPEFALNGKSAITVRMVMQHAAGLAAIPFTSPVPIGGWADWTTMTNLIGGMAPWWEPGTAHGYHAMTFGWLVGELVRRVSSISIGQYFANTIATPLGLDFWIGAPAHVLPRVSPMLPNTDPPGNDPFTVKMLTDPASMQSAVFFNMGGWFGLPPATPPVYNSTTSLQAQIPAAGGITNGRGLATMYAALANGGALGSTQLLPAEYAAQIGAIHSALPIDRTVLMKTRFGYGFHGSIDNRNVGPGRSVILGTTAFGHAAFGGSIGFADPTEQVSLGYTMNRMGAGAGLNDRGQSLVDALYKTLGYTSNKYGFWTRAAHSDGFPRRDTD
jgi:CubicO group peptidase (beta-lactamase class C family)